MGVGRGGRGGREGGKGRKWGGFGGSDVEWVAGNSGFEMDWMGLVDVRVGFV